MESKRIRSAWEIALERAERLGNLSGDELRAKEQDEWREMGRGLGARWLAGLPARDLRLELSRQEGARRAVVVQNAVGSLADALSLHMNEQTQRAIEGLKILLGAGALARLEEELRALCVEYEQFVTRERDSLRRKVEQAWAPELRRRGIAGTAVQLNLQSLPEWKAAILKAEEKYRDRLAQLQRQVREIC